MGILFETKGLREVLSGIGDAASGLEQELHRIGGAKARKVAVEALEEYPPQSHKKQPFKTDKSRRAFFAMLKRGQITVPYERTERLKRAWARATPIYTSGGGMQLTNPIPHADWVQGEDQAAYHEGNWKTVKQILDAIEPDIEQAYEDGITAWLKTLAS